MTQGKIVGLCFRHPSLFSLLDRLRRKGQGASAIGFCYVFRAISGESCCELQKSSIIPSIIFDAPVFMKLSDIVDIGVCRVALRVWCVAVFQQVTCYANTSSNICG